MKMKHRNAIVPVIVLLCMLAAGCKKKDDETTFRYLTGLPSFTVPQYATMNQTFTATPAKVTNPDGGGYGYYWKTSWENKNDTTKTVDSTSDGSYTFTTPGEIGEYTVTCVVFADGFSTSSSRSTIYVIDTELGTTITDDGIAPADPRMTDPRDGKVYYTTTVGGQTWMRQNLGYDGSGIPYLASTAMDHLFGRFYTWEEAGTACPAGWHLPSDAEWKELAQTLSGATFTEGKTYTDVAGKIMANAKFLGNRMWEYWPQVDITNESGLSALPVGYCVESGSTRFVGLNSYAAFWTADGHDGMGLYRYLYVDKNDLFAGLGDNDSFRATVRCVKD